FTSAIQNSGFFSTKLGSVHCGSNGPTPIAFSIAPALTWTVLSPTSNAAHRCRRHVRRKRFVAEKVYPPKNIDDAERPRSWLSGSYARALPAKHPGHCTRQVPVFGV